MKKENIITISQSGAVVIPDKVRMQDVEIAELLGSYPKTIRTHAKQILKSGICRDDGTNGGEVWDGVIIPEYFGMDMVIAIAFRINSLQAKILRDVLLRRMNLPTDPTVCVQIGRNNHDKQREIFN